MKIVRQSLSFLPFILIALALLAYVGYFVIYNYYAWSLFNFPFDYDQGEGFELVDTILFGQGEWPYRSNDSYPFYSSNYPPVFHLVIMPLVWIFGPQYWTGRVVSWVGTLITAAAISYGVQREIKRWWLSLIVGLAYLASNYIYHVGPLFRQHLFMVMLETVAIVYLTVLTEREEARGFYSWPRLLVVMGLLLLAGYTKQLAYATVIATFGFLLLRDWKRAIKWAIPFGLVTGLIFLLINVATGGEWFVATVIANINEFMPGQGRALFTQWWTLHRVLIVISLIYVVSDAAINRTLMSAYSIWFVLTAVNAIVTAGKWGAGESYYATAIAASCILTGLAFGQLLNNTRPYKIIHTISLAVVALLLLNQADRVFHMPTHTPELRAIARFLNKPQVSYIAPQTSCSPERTYQIIPWVDSAGATLLGRPPGKEDRQSGENLVKIVEQSGEGAIFSEEAAFNLRLGRDVVTNPTQLLNIYKNERVDLTEMLQMLENKQFPAVILRGQLYPEPVLQMIGQHYHHEHLVQMNGFVYCVLLPNETTQP